MSVTRLVLIYCDAKTPDCDYPNDPIQGDSDETATELLKRARWQTGFPSSFHECVGCAEYRRTHGPRRGRYGAR